MEKNLKTFKIIGNVYIDDVMPMHIESEVYAEDSTKAGLMFWNLFKKNISGQISIVEVK